MVGCPPSLLLYPYNLLIVLHCQLLYYQAVNMYQYYSVPVLQWFEGQCCYPNC